MQHDGGMIWVANMTTDINTRIALHSLPSPVLGVPIARQNLLVLGRSHAVGVAVADVTMLEALKRPPDAECVGPFLQALTLGSWFERRVTWSLILLAEFFDADLDASVHERYMVSDSRRRAALALTQSEAPNTAWRQALPAPVFGSSSRMMPSS